MIEKKKGKTFKTLNYLGKPSKRIPQARDFAGYYHAPEAGLDRALMASHAELQSYQPLSRGPKLLMLGPDRFIVGLESLLYFERNSRGRVIAMTIETPNGRLRRMRFKKFPLPNDPSN